MDCGEEEGKIVERKRKLQGNSRVSGFLKHLISFSYNPGWESYDILFKCVNVPQWWKGRGQAVLCATHGHGSTVGLFLQMQVPGSPWVPGPWGQAFCHLRKRRLWDHSFNFFFVKLEVLPWWFSGKESTCNAGGMGSVPGLGWSPPEGNGNPLQCSYLENLMDSGAWRATVNGVAKSQTWLSDWTATFRLKQLVWCRTASQPTFSPEVSVPGSRWDQLHPCQ